MTGLFLMVQRRSSMTHVTFLTDAVTCRRLASEGTVTERTTRGAECEGRQQQGCEDFLGPSAVSKPASCFT